MPNAHLPPISQTIQVRQKRHAGPCRREKFSCGLLHIAAMQSLADQQEFTWINSVWTMDAVYSTCQEQWMILTNGKIQCIRAWLPYLTAYKAHFFFTKISFKIQNKDTPASYMPYIGLKFVMVGRNELPGNSY